MAVKHIMILQDKRLMLNCNPAAVAVVENRSGIVIYSKIERGNAKLPSVIPQACLDCNRVL